MNAHRAASDTLSGVVSARVPNVACTPAANSNGPLVQLEHVGDGRAVYRAIARVIVRRELIAMGILNDRDRCEETRQAG
jgi:hypothetical protein